MQKILVVEDQSEISYIVLKYLQDSGYQCDLAENGFEALELFSLHKFHLVILDVMLPGIDGFEILKRIREISEVPVIMLTARKEEIDKLKGFKGGADDYVTKPFSPNELVQRVKVFMKRVYSFGDEVVITVGSFKLYTESKQLYIDEKLIELTSAEYCLIEVLMKNHDQILSREQLIELAYGFDYDGFDRNIDTYIKRIRQKIEPNSKEPIYLKTKYGLGYVFVGENV